MNTTAVRRALQAALGAMLLAATLVASPTPAGADGTCTASGTITQAPPTVSNPNPPVTYNGAATCSTTHWMGLTTHLTLDCGFSCSDVATGGDIPGWRTRTSSTDTYFPNACPPVPTTLFGETHTWYLFTYLYAENVGGGWHSASGYTTLPFRCPGLLA